jgi:hypothetical protein
MGIAGSTLPVQLQQELDRPLDGSDVAGAPDSALVEVRRLRSLLAEHAGALTQVSVLPPEPSKDLLIRIQYKSLMNEDFRGVDVIDEIVNLQQGKKRYY